MQLDELDADVEDILRGYSLWMRDTNIPNNHAKARDKGKDTVTYMAYSGLKDYLSKTIHVLKDLLPDNALKMRLNLYQVQSLKRDGREARCVRVIHSELSQRLVCIVLHGTVRM
jgi:hypothetical protein